MSIPFSQSMQSLHADHGRRVLGGIGLVVVLLLLWAGWLLTPSLTTYTTGTLTAYTRRGTLVASFPAQSYRHLHPGQAAWIEAASAQQAPQLSAPKLSATVMEVELTEAGDGVQIWLYPENTVDVKTLFPQGVRGQVTVETETISPAILLLRTTGLLVDTPPVSLSPQE